MALRWLQQPFRSIPYDLDPKEIGSGASIFYSILFGYFPFNNVDFIDIKANEQVIIYKRHYKNAVVWIIEDCRV